MSDLVFKVIQARLGGKVERCHNVPHHGSYSVAAHTWGALVLLWQVFPEHWPRISPVLLAHDVGEGWLGDIPAPTMRYVPGLREIMSGLEGMLVAELGFVTEHDLTKEEFAIFKACDRLELYLWAREQAIMGNLYAEDIILELARYFQKEPLPGAAFLLYQKLTNSTVVPRQAGIVQAIVEQVTEQEATEGLAVT